MHDFTHVDDLVAGVAAVVENRQSAIGQTFCMTAGKAVSLLNLAEIVQANIPGTEIQFGPADPDKPSRGTMTVSKAWRCLGWQPRVELADGMASLVEWYRTFLAQEKRHAA